MALLGLAGFVARRRRN
ncbi:MAG: LPXTG cell wall anchor domain-containing protein [Planctomycetota bacterium]|nr:MAG: LPXTG cell wall anchor domain-containing protein [Planctomycetota bacterium]